MEAISTHNTALLALLKRIFLQNAQQNSTAHSRGWTLRGFSLLSLFILLLGFKGWGQTILATNNFSTFPGTGWTVSSSGSNPYNPQGLYPYSRCSSYPNIDNCCYFDTYYAGNGSIGTLTSPVFSLSGYSAATLSLKLINNGSNGGFNVKLSIDGGTSYPYTIASNPTNSTSNFVVSTYNLSAYLGQSNCRLQFNGISNYGSAQCNCIYLDDVGISGTVACTPPSTQATIGSFTYNTGTSVTSNWTRGDGTGGVLVVARLTSTTAVAPVSGSSYTANTTFGSGTTTGTGNFVVYQGTGTSVNVTGLTGCTGYTFDLYEYNTTGTCFKTTASSGVITTYGSCSQTFTSSGSWTAPCGVTSATVECWGGGGGGGFARSNNGASGGGGGGGAYASSAVSVTPNTSYSLVVGSAGTGGSASGTAPTNGLASSFNTSSVVAAGGTAGNSASTNTNATGGAGGTTAASTGTASRAGGAGASGSASGGGGGGACANSTSNGNGGSGVTGGTGVSPSGNGGTCTGNNANGSSGLTYGGGGSGGRRNSSNSSGGAGAAGLVKITWDNATSATPTVTSPICPAATSVSGTSTEATGSTVTVYKNGVVWGTTTTITSNAWSVTGAALSAADVITAKVQASCKYISAASNAVTVASCNTPTISVTGTLNAFTSCSGTASATQNFSVSGISMSAGITITPPTGFEVSTTSNFSSNIGTNSSPITIGAAGTIASTIIYVRLQSSASGTPSGNVACSSTSATTVNVSASGTVTPSISGNSSGAAVSICSGTTTTLTGGTMSGGSGSYTYLWESSSNNSTWATAAGTSNGANYTTAALSSNTYFRRTATSGACSNVASSVLVTINTLPAAPTAGSNSRCGTGTVAITATPGAGETIDWYVASSGGSVLTTGTPNPAQGTTSFTTPSISNTTNYYAVARNTTTGCVSSTRTAVTATINAVPAAPTAAATQSFCSNANPTVASLSATGTSIQWYAASTGGSAIASGTALTTATSYYASQTIGGCESTSRTAVAVSISNPVTPSVSIGSSDADNSFCSGTSVTFTATASNLGGGTAAYQWKLNGLNVGTNSTTYTSSALTNSNTVSCTITVTGGCVTSSTANSSTITNTVNALPTLSYAGSPLTYTQNSVISNLSPTTTATSFTVSPALPSNLSLTASTGVISGTPGTSQGATDYSITGTATNGCTITAVISIAIVPANDLICNAISVTCGSSVSGTTKNATKSGTGENQTCTVSQDKAGVWYSIVGNGNSINSSLCGTSWDSKISVFSGTCSSLTCVGGNDDSGPSCTGTSASYSWTSVSGTTYYILVHGFSTNSDFTLAITSTTSTPSAITGTASVCASSTGNVYSVTNVSGLTYNWSVPSGWSGSSSTNSITLTAGSSGGTLSVTGTSSCGTSEASTITLYANSIATTPSSVTATTPICLGSSTNLNATSSNNTINWYDAATGGTLLGTSASAANLNYSPASAGSYTYYAEAMNSSSAGSQTFNYSGNIENWTVPTNVFTISIDAKGAQGGTQPEFNYGGKGARIVGTVAVTPGQVLKILVGQQGATGASDDGAGGGGGTFVTDNSNNPLVVAGGGGGDGADQAGVDASTSTTTTNNGIGTASHTGTTGGSGYNGGGGGGLTGNGSDGYNGSANAGGGKSFTNGGAGGTGYRNGGFGGGGAGSSDTEGAGGGGGYGGGAGGDNFIGSWDAAAGGSSYSSVTPTTATATQTGNGQVIISWSAFAGCPSPRTSVAVTVDPLSVGGSVSGGTTVCSGTNSTSLTLSGNTGSVTKWQSSTDGTSWSDIANTTTTYTVTNISSTTYYRAVVKSGSCSIVNSSSATMTVNSRPTSAVLSGTASICNGSSANLAVAVTGGTSPYTVVYTGNGGGTVSSYTSGSSIAQSPSSNATYGLTSVTDANGCAAVSVSGAPVITVNSRPTSAVISGETSICNGSSANLAVAVTGGTSPYTVVYTGNGGGTVSSYTSGSSIAQSPSSNATYGLTSVTDANGCTAVSVSGAPVITVNSLPTVTASANPTTACLGQTVTLTGVSGMSSYTWTGPSGATISDASAPSPTVTMGATSGTFTLTATNINGCTASASTLSVTSGTPNVAGLSAGDVIWSGSNSSDWNSNTNWVVYNGPSSYSIPNTAPQTTTSVKIPATGTCVVNMPEVIGSKNANNVTILAGAQLTVTGTLEVAGSVSINASGTLGGNGTINVSDGWVNNGTFNAGSGTVVFNGTTNASIISGTNSFYNLSLNGGSALEVTLSNAISVSNTLALTTGKVILGANNLTVGASGAISGGSSSSFVVTNSTGVLKQQSIDGSAAAGKKVFPIGLSTSSYTPMILANAGTSDDFSARVTSGVLQSGTSGSAITTKYINRTWLIDETSAGGSNATLTLGWNAAEEQGQFTRTACFVTHYTGGSWDLSTATSASGTPYTTFRSGITSFSPFSVTSTSALPIELISFQANCSDNNTVDVTWSTASEHNTNYFRVDKSRDGLTWDVLNTIGAAGNSNYAIDYALTDAFPNPGINYYRLTQYDLDGVFETFDAQAAVCKDQQSGTALSSYPNPSSGDFNVDLQTDELEGEATLLITDAKGAVVHSQDINIIKGNNNYVIHPSTGSGQGFEPGIYYISVRTATSTVTTKHSMR